MCLFCLVCSVVTVSKILLSVGFGRFLLEKPRFSVRFRFLSVSFSPCRQCGTFMRPTAHQTCSSTLHISVYNSSRQQQVCNSVWLVAWKPPPVPNVAHVAKRYLSGSLRHWHLLLVSICTARRHTCSQTDVTGWLQKKLICCCSCCTTCHWSVLNTEYSVHEIDHWHAVRNKWALQWRYIHDLLKELRTHNRIIDIIQTFDSTV